MILQRHDRGDYIITDKGYKTMVAVAELHRLLTRLLIFDVHFFVCLGGVGLGSGPNGRTRDPGRGGAVVNCRN